MPGCAGCNSCVELKKKGISSKTTRGQQSSSIPDDHVVSRPVGFQMPSNRNVMSQESENCSTKPVVPCPTQNPSGRRQHRYAHAHVPAQEPEIVVNSIMRVVILPFIFFLWFLPLSDSGMGVLLISFVRPRYSGHCRASTLSSGPCFPQTKPSQILYVI